MDRSNVLKESLGNFLRNAFDLMVLNWLWILCSLPVVTIGPATCALYSVTLKLCRDEAVYPVRDFFRGFRENFKQGVVLGILAILLAVVAAGDAFFALQQTGLFYTVFLVVSIMVAAVFLTVITYTFALQAMFRNPLKVHIRNAFSLAFVSPGKTVMMWLICLFPILAALLLPRIAVEMLGFLYLVAGVSGPVFLNSRVLRDIFDKVNGGPVIPAPPAEETDTDS